MSEQQSTRKAIPKRSYESPTIVTVPVTSALVKTFLDQRQEWKLRQNDEQKDNAEKEN